MRCVDDHLKVASDALDRATCTGSADLRREHLFVAVVALHAAVYRLTRPRRRSLTIGPLIVATGYRDHEAGSGPRDLFVLWRDFRRVLVRVPAPWSR